MAKASSSGFISLTKAKEMTARYRQNRNSIINPSYSDQDIIPICDKFDRNIFDKLLSKPGCSAIRLYYGMDESLKIHPIVVAVNEKDEDILPNESNLETDDIGDDIGDDTLRCPPYCPPPSPLNE